MENSADVVIYDMNNSVVTLTLNRPERRNALSLDLMLRFIEHLQAVRESPNVHVVVVRGAGKVFCSGHDLSELHANREPTYLKRLFQTCSELMSMITTLPQPVIAAVHGVASAAGLQLVASCDLAIATSGAQFAVPGVNIGLFCSTPMVALSRNVSPKHAMEMLVTGELYSADHAARIGLINRVVPEELFNQAIDELCLSIAGKSARTVATGKQAFYRQLEMSYGDAYSYTCDVMIDNMLKPDAKEGISAFLEKRTPRWEP